MDDSLWVVVVVFIEAFLHYFPWHHLLGKELPRLLAYGFGVLGMMVPFTAWLLGRGDIGTAIMLWIILSAGGLVVGLLHLLDWVINQVWGKREAEQREHVLKEQLHGKGKSA